MTPEFALSLLVAVASAVGSIVVVMVNVGRQAERIAAVTKEAETMKGKIEKVEAASIEHTAQIHAVKNAQNAAELRHSQAIEKVEVTLEVVRSEVVTIGKMVAKIDARLDAA